MSQRAGHPSSYRFLLTRLVLAGLLVLMTGNSHAQTAVDSSVIDLAQIGILDPISGKTWYYFSDNKEITADQLRQVTFTAKGTRKYESFVPAGLVNKALLLRFTVSNSHDSTEKVYFCPGFYFNSIRVFKMDEQDTSRIAEIPSILPTDADSLGYRLISLRAHEKSRFFAVLSFIKSSTNALYPTLTRIAYIHQAVALNHKYRTNIDLITSLFAGIMLMMIFYALSQYSQSTKPEFLYYAGYAICTSCLLYLKATLLNSATPFNYFFEGYLDNIIFCVGYIFFIVFHRKFLDTKRNYPGLDPWLYWGSNGVLILMVLYTVTFFFSPDFRIPNLIEDSTKIFLLLISLVFIIKGFRYRNDLMNYIILGNVSLCLLSILSQVMISTNFKPAPGFSIWNLALFYYEIGITIELLFFLFALSYKNKKEIILSAQKEEKLKLETERKELEKQVAVLAAKQDERNRISADMHDELGSGVTAIRLMSEIVKSKMKEQTLPEIEKISHSANELLNKMNTIIWTMTSSNDSVENLVAYIRSYAVEFFENTSIDCYFNMPAEVPHHEISGEKRRNIFLSIKESLNNALKHSQASAIRINVSVNDQLIIEIFDNGVGINMEKLRKFGNGLNNMKKRMASIEGEFFIENKEGTRTCFTLAL